MQSIDRIVINSVPLPERVDPYGPNEAWTTVLPTGIVESAFVDGTFPISFQAGSPPRTLYVKPSVFYQPNQIVLACGMGWGGTVTPPPPETNVVAWGLLGDFQFTVFFREGKPSAPSATAHYSVSGSGTDWSFVQSITNVDVDDNLGVYGLTYASAGFWRTDADDNFSNSSAVTAGMRSNGYQLVKAVVDTLRTKPPIAPPRRYIPPSNVPAPEPSGWAPRIPLPGLGRSGGGGKLTNSNAPKNGTNFVCLTAPTTTSVSIGNGGSTRSICYLV